MNKNKLIELGFEVINLPQFTIVKSNSTRFAISDDKQKTIARFIADFESLAEAEFQTKYVI